MPAPALVIVPGLWLGPRPYELLASELKSQSATTSPITEVIYAPLISTGTKSPGNPSMADDAMGIRKVIKPLVEAGKRVVLVGHSAGAFLSAMATEDLEVGEKIAAASGRGGVERFVFVAGGILPVGGTHPDMSTFVVKDGGMYCKDPDELLWHDVDPSLVQKYQACCESQPAEGWTGTCTYTGWSKVPSGYILTENDRVIPAAVQEMCAGLAGSEVVRMATGHMPMISEPKLLAEKILGFLKVEN